MQHSHEELRTAAFDVLSGRVPFAYQADHYAHLKIGVATALLERQGPIDQERQCGYPQDAALEPVLKVLLELPGDFSLDGLRGLERRQRSL